MSAADDVVRDVHAVLLGLVGRKQELDAVLGRHGLQTREPRADLLRLAVRHDGRPRHDAGALRARWPRRSSG